MIPRITEPGTFTSVLHGHDDTQVMKRQGIHSHVGQVASLKIESIITVTLGFPPNAYQDTDVEIGLRCNCEQLIVVQLHIHLVLMVSELCKERVLYVYDALDLGKIIEKTNRQSNRFLRRGCIT